MQVDLRAHAFASLSAHTSRTMDDDLKAMSRERLIAEAKKLRAGIRAQRQFGARACWHQPGLWGSCLSGPTRSLRCRHGRSSFAGASAIANLSTSNCLTRTDAHYRS